jgi:prophage regulatory protein
MNAVAQIKDERRKRKEKRRIRKAELKAARRFLGPVLRKPEAISYCALSNTQFDELIKKGEFPRPIKISDSGRSIAWIKVELDTWLAKRIELRDAKAS